MLNLIKNLFKKENEEIQPPARRLEKFNLAKFKQGQSVIYRNGHEPDQIFIMEQITAKYPILSVYDGNAYSHNLEGVTYVGIKEHDLFMKPRGFSVWVPIFKYNKQGWRLNTNEEGRVFFNKGDAIHKYKNNPLFINAFEIFIEDENEEDI